MLYIYCALAIICAASTAYFVDFASSLSYIWALPCFFLVALLSLLVFHVLICFILSLMVDMRKPVKYPTSKLLYAWVTGTVGLLLQFMRIKMTFEGEDMLPRENKFLLISNHVSHFDPLVTLYLLRKKSIVFVSKRENMKIPIAGPLTYKLGFLPINRENDREALKTILKAISHLNNGYGAMGIYPEGRTIRDGKLGSFKPGVFKIAQKAQCPIVVTHIEGTETATNNFPWRHTRVKLSLKGIIPYEDVREASTQQIAEIACKLMIAPQ